MCLTVSPTLKVTLEGRGVLGLLERAKYTFSSLYFSISSAKVASSLRVRGVANKINGDDKYKGDRITCLIL